MSVARRRDDHSDGGLAQHVVAGLVAVLVVVALEVVEVEQGDVEGRAVAPAAGDLAAECLLPTAAVRHAGQLVGGGQALQPLDQLARSSSTSRKCPAWAPAPSSSPPARPGAAWPPARRTRARRVCRCRPPPARPPPSAGPLPPRPRSARDGSIETSAIHIAVGLTPTPPPGRPSPGPSSVRRLTWANRPSWLPSALQVSLQRSRPSSGAQ